MEAITRTEFRSSDQRPKSYVRNFSRFLRVALALAVVTSSGCSRGELAATGPSEQPTAAAPLLTDAEVKAKYQTCPVGYYSGPQPGKAHYTKDTFTWTVTPQFASQFCMPSNFVDGDLNHLEALAYRMVEDQDEETCGWGGKQENCVRGRDHNFEMYFKSGTIDKLRDARYQHIARLPSAMLLTENAEVWERRHRQINENPVPGAAAVFSPGQFHLVSLMSNGRILSLELLLSTIYYKDAVAGLDYTKLEGASGFTKRSVWKRAKLGALAILVRSPYRGDGPEPQTRRYTSDPQEIPPSAQLIRLPKVIAQKVIENDMAHGVDIVEFAGRKNPTAPPVSKN